MLQVNEEKYSDSYDMLCDLVGGYIEVMSYVAEFRERGISLVINEEGKIINLEPSMVFLNKGNIVDMVMGNVVFVKVDEEGNTIPLNDEDVVFVEKYINSNRVILSSGDDTRLAVVLKV